MLGRPQIIKKFGCRLNARNQQMVSRTRAGNVKKVSFSIVDILQIGIVTDGLDTLLQGNDFIIASHHRHGAKLQTFCEVHGADRDVATCRIDMSRREP